MPSRIVAAVLALAALAGCGAVSHRVYVAVQVTRYIEAHGGKTSDYKLYLSQSGSMLPTIPIRAQMLVNLKAYHGASRPARGDLAVFWPPIHEPDPFVKRIVALPGDTLRLQGGVLYVNGHAIVEPYIKQRADYALTIRNYGIYVADDGNSSEALDPQTAYVPRKPAWSAADRLPADCYFVLGDNRNDSEDSHIYGCIKHADLVGKIVAVYP